MDTNSWKRGVSIEPLKVRVKSGEYTYCSEGLKKGRYSFDLDVKKYLPHLKPERTKQGIIKVRQPSVQKQPLGYWKAQCAFRNLQQSGTIVALQQRLRKAKGLGMASELVQKEKDLKEEFSRKIQEARAKSSNRTETDQLKMLLPRDDVWDRMETDEEKAEAYPKRFVEEKFFSNPQSKKVNSTNVVVVRTHLRWPLHTAAESLGLCTESVDASLDAAEGKPEVNRWIVIGRTESAVKEEIQKVMSEAVQMRQRGLGASEKVKPAQVAILKRPLVLNKLGLGVCNAPVDGLLGAQGSQPKVDRGIAIGSTQTAEREEIQRVAREAARVRQRAEDASEERKRKLPETVVSKEKKKPTSDQKKKPTRDVEWDVAGSWSISCPYVESQWGGTFGRGSECSLDIQFTKRNSRCIRQMWAKFDFIVITGVFRFESPSSAMSSGKSESKSEVKKKRKSIPTSVSWTSVVEEDFGEDDDRFNSEEGDEFNSEEDDDFNSEEEDGESPTREEFFLGSKEKPSASCPQWNFRWRGEDTGESVIELYSDRELCSVTFGGVDGTELTGRFKSSLTGNIKFTGVKAGPSISSPSGYTIEDEWRARSAMAYERARVGRWR